MAAFRAGPGLAVTTAMIAATSCVPGLLVAVVTSGCGFFFRVGAGPAADSEGRTSFEVVASVGFGSAVEGSALSTVVSAGGGRTDSTRNLGVGLEASGKFDDHSAGHLGLGYRSRDFVGIGGESTARGVSARAGVGYMLAEGRRRRRLVNGLSALVVGVELEVGYLWGRSGRGILSLPAYIELYNAN